VEEIGLLGSRSFAEKHADTLRKIRFYLNMDSAGRSGPKDVNLHEWPILQATFERYRKEMVLDFAIGQSFFTASDHYPLLVKGVPTGGIEAVRQSRTGRGYGHTRYDTVDKLTLSDLRDASSLAARLALRIAKDEDWPANSRDEDEVAKLFEKSDQIEVQDFREKLDALYAQVK
jgi:Zn-dependent M28 family amino/carboxypeptidase